MGSQGSCLPVSLGPGYSIVGRDPLRLADRMTRCSRANLSCCAEVPPALSVGRTPDGHALLDQTLLWPSRPGNSITMWRVSKAHVAEAV